MMFRVQGSGSKNQKKRHSGIAGAAAAQAALLQG